MLNINVKVTHFAKERSFYNLFQLKIVKSK